MTISLDDNEDDDDDEPYDLSSIVYFCFFPFFFLLLLLEPNPSANRAETEVCGKKFDDDGAPPLWITWML